jgi:hypothetical protein
MIIFVNQKIKKIELYDKNGLVSIPFNESWKLKNYMKEGKVLYITNAIETTIDRIMETVDSIRGFGKDSQGNQISSNGKEPLYIHYAKGKEYLNMASINIMFKGVTDFYAVDKIKKQFGDDIFEKDDILKMYLGNGKLEIITASEMNQFLSEYVDEREEKLEKSLSSLIINDKVEKFIDGGSVGDDTPDRDGAVVIDLNKSKFGGGGSTENEGSLLPEDF